jgi:hypothetical protein
LFSLNILTQAASWWLTPVILATQETEIRKIVVLSQLGKYFVETLSGKKTITKKGLVEWLEM